METFNFIPLGPPMGGKNEQQELLCKQYPTATVIETGEIMRAFARGDCDEDHHLFLLQKKFQKANEAENINKGNLAPDIFAQALVSTIIMNEPVRNPILRIWNGFPRTAEQMLWLIDYLKKRNERISLVGNLVVPDEELDNRLACANRNRKDDLVFSTRLKTYYQVTAAIIPLTKELGIPYEDINGVGSVFEVNERILSLFTKHGNHVI